ncbi:MAG: phage tail protein [Lachnospiraceae bacterium]|nr:phage tail protein [Lachnospiraceae bacterium]
MNLLHSGNAMLSGRNFLVTIGQEIFSFSKVSNLVAQVEYETVQEGGNNEYPLLFPKQKTSPDTLILEKGVREWTFDPRFNSLWEGMQVEQVTILLLKYGIILRKAFFFKKGLIVKRSFSDLDALRGELLIETLEIAHSGLVEIPI